MHAYACQTLKASGGEGATTLCRGSEQSTEIVPILEPTVSTLSSITGGWGFERTCTERLVLRVMGYDAHVGCRVMIAGFQLAVFD